MIGALNTQGQKYWVGIVQWAPETLVLEEIADIFRNFNIDNNNDNNNIKNNNIMIIIMMMMMMMI